MDLDRPHHRTTTTTTTTTTSELFICFTSRLSSSSSSMKLTKSILSPARARDQPVSLPTSLSRRLRTNGSIKGGQASPMFPTNGKKRGSVLDNPEPSSPKVTCIGQVRVKTKKKVKQSQRSLSSKRSSDVSFRRLEQAPSDPLNQNEDKFSIQNQRFSHSNSTVHYQSQECVSHRNQRWVHLPLTICEALRGFGSEFSCLFPCRSSSCFSTTENKEREEKIDGSKDVNNGQRSCGAVFARWLVALQDGEAGKGREIELVVASTTAGEDDERIETKQSTMRSSRRHVFEDLEFNDIEAVEMEGGREEEKARVSICVPPKNALLLMRCRSDPMKMADLTNRFWESPAPKEEEEVVDAQNCELNNGVEVIDEGCEVPEEDLVENEDNPEVKAAMEMEVESLEQEKHEEKLENDDLAPETEQEESEAKPLVPEVNSLEQFSEAMADQAPQDIEEDNTVLEPEEEEEENVSTSKTEDEAEALAGEAELEEEEEDRFKSTISKEIQETLLLADIAQNQTMTLQESEDKEEEEEERLDPDSEIAEPEKIETQVLQNQEVVKNQFEYTKDPPPKEQQKKESLLPECLLLMMCEPKLSMEVSKETWVCSTDFIRWLPERKQVLIKPPPPPPKQQVIVPEDKEQPKRRRSIDSKPPLKAHVNNRSQHLLQPPRSSCSFPATGGVGAPAMSMATMIEQKLVNAVAYEPFVLTRCKSEPMKTAAAKLAPDTCFWKNREIEPHRRSAFGVGAAGVGF